MSERDPHPRLKVVRDSPEPPNVFFEMLPPLAVFGLTVAAQDRVYLKVGNGEAVQLDPPSPGAKMVASRCLVQPLRGTLHISEGEE